MLINIIILYYNKPVWSIIINHASNVPNIIYLFKKNAVSNVLQTIIQW